MRIETRIVTRHPRADRLIVAALATILCTSALAAQPKPGTIVGTVRSTTTQLPLISVSLDIAGTGHRGFTDSLGAYRLGETLAGDVQLNARAVGYEPASFRITMRTDVATLVNLQLKPLPTLAPVTVSEAGVRRGDERMADFHERKRSGFGRFVTREDIERRNVSDSRELMRGIPGVKLIGSRVAMSSGMSSNCAVQYFVDGVHIVAPPSDFLVQFRPRDLEGIEVYRGPAETPVEFSRGGASCGVIVLWTRTPGGNR
jgi:hypothetical protein